MGRTTLGLCLALLVFASTPGAAQETSLTNQLLGFIYEDTNLQKTFGDLQQEARSLVGTANVAVDAEIEAAAAVQPDAVAALTLANAATVAEAAPGTVAAPDGFGTRVNDSLTNFLPLLGFAVNTVSTSEDEKSVSVVYNPVRIGRRGTVSFSSTISEPEGSTKLVEAIEQSAQSEQKTAIGNSLDDFSDLTFSGTYGYHRDDEGSAWGDGHHLWGRNPKLYQNLAEELMENVWTAVFAERPVPSVVEFSDLSVEIFDRVGDVPDDDVNLVTIEQLRGAFTRDELEAVLPVLEVFAFSTQDFYDKLGELDLSHLAAMVANQPQFTVTGAYRDRDELVGGDETVYTLKLEIGVANLNRAMSHYKKRKSADPEYTLLDAYKWATEELESQKQNRTFFSVTYKERDAWNPSYPYQLEIPDPAGGDPTTIDKVASLAVPAGEDLCLKAGWSRTFKRTTSTVKSRATVEQLAAFGDAASVPELRALANAELDVPARLDVSLEYIDVDGDDPLMRDRGIARLSYAMPLPGGLSLPFTFTYANHSQFLGEQDDVFSTHIGLNYTLPGQ